jgi:hypothetical protein
MGQAGRSARSEEGGMTSEEAMVRYAIDLMQRGDREQMRRQDIIRAELNVPVDVEVYHAEQSTKH